MPSENLRELLKEEYPEYPYLCNVFAGAYRTETIYGRPEKAAANCQSNELCL